MNIHRVKFKDIEQEDPLNIILNHHSIARIDLPEFPGEYFRLR